MDHDRWRRLEDLYHAARPLPVDARARFLDSECGSDELLRSEVEALLAQPEHTLVVPDGSGHGPHDDLVGKRIAHYDVRSLAGAGGMGQVYRARDTRLGRDVALKVLPPEWITDPDRLARLEREARLLASLNHPNIATIHGLEDTAAIRVVVLEYIEGDTLADRIGAGPLAVAEALSIARQVKDALEAAHERNIVHRDLKPANIKVTPTGLVKVLDFGLATLEPLVGGPLDRSRLPTVTTRGTREGVIAGTAAYMSPEQARGLAIDKRTDIWAFGCVLYEMVAGRTAFGRATLTDTLAAVVEGEPDWAALPRNTPRGVERLLRQCLEKDHRKRLRDVGDAWILLEAEAPAPMRVGPSTPAFWALGGTAAAVVATAAAMWLWLTPAKVEPSVRITSLLAPEGSEYDFVSVGSFLAPPTLSPDGRRLVFGARSLDGTATQLWVRSMDSLTAQPLPGTESGAFPFWSPDGRYVAFGSRVDKALKKIDVLGGPPVTITSLNAELRGGSWNADGVILFGDGRPDAPIMKVSQSGGAFSPATAVEQATDTYGHKFPWFLPDGRRFLYIAPRSGGPNSVRIGSLDDAAGPGKVVAEAESNAIYSQGHLLSLRGGTLLAQPFDLRTLQSSGDARAIVERIPTSLQPGRFGHFSASATGLLVHPAAGPEALSTSLVWRDRSGKQLGAAEAVAGRVVQIRLSPDETSLLASITERNSNDLWVYDLARSRRIRFTFDPGAEPYAIWSRDGRTVIWRNGPGALYRKTSNLTGTEEVLSADTGQSPSSVSPDDKTLLIVKGGVDIWSMPLVPNPSGSSAPRPVLASAAGEDHAQWSPDGKWMAYTSDESKIREAYVMAYPGPGGKQQVSSGGASHVRWRSDGRELFYVTRSGDLMAAEITVRGDTLGIGRIQRLFGGVQSVDGAQGYTYDVSVDGTKFIVAEGLERRNAAPQAVTLVENWTGLLSASSSR